MTDREMLSPFRRGIETYNLISDGDKVAVGVSGGKDSVTLLTLLAGYKRFSPQKFDLIAIAVDLKFGGEKSDFTLIKEHCERLGVPFFIVDTDIGEVVFDVRKEKNPCALCSKMRKGALYGKAKEEGCNKVALGHHADDFIDTFMLSLFYEGRLNTFSPKSYLDRTGLTLIRPMVFIKEIDVKSYAKTLPVLKSRCPADKHTKREYVKDVLKNIGEKVPNIREMIFTALTHPERNNLFDNKDGF